MQGSCILTGAILPHGRYGWGIAWLLVGVRRRKGREGEWRLGSDGRVLAALFSEVSTESRD